KVGIHIKEASKEDVGEYECLLTNPYGKRLVRIRVNLKEDEPAIFSRKLSDVETVEGREAQFSATVDGCPEPDVQWHFEDNLLEKSLKYVEGREAQFSATVDGCPEPDVQWHFEDNLLEKSLKYVMKRDGKTAYLFVRECQLNDIGKYSCIAKNSAGKDYSSAQLRVKPN
ncbi:unnamed protein product, partial [Notodromas monacha]